MDAASFPDSAGHSLEVYVRLRPATLIAIAKGHQEGAKFTLAVRLRNAFGAREHDAEQEFAVSSGDTSAGYGKVVVFPIRTRPGTHRLQVKMTTHGHSLTSSGVGRAKVESIEGEVVVPGPQAERDLSDLEFVWSEAKDRSAPLFRHGERFLLPNPERLYGLFADSLRASVVARSRSGDERPWHWVARVLDPQGGVVAGRESTSAAGRWLHAEIAIDISKQPAGGYDLELKAWQEGDQGSVLRRAHFSVAWEAGTWNRSPQDILDDAHFLLQPEAEETFAHLMPGEQERVMDDFWRERDPTPETAENEARLTYLKRVDFANRTYGRYGLGKGMFSDMGRVFIRYGEPGEVLKQVIPARDNTLEDVVRSLAAEDKRVVGDVSDKAIGADMRPFEVWIYEGDIAPPPDADPGIARATRTRRRLVFLFVDEQWLGDYRLRYSTE